MAYQCSFSLADEVSNDRRTAHQQYERGYKWPEDYTLTRSSFWKQLQSGQWECPHKPVAENRCYFHLDPDKYDTYGIDDDDVSEALLKAIREDDPELNRFIGATFDDLNLRYQIIDDSHNRPIDLHFSTVRGTLDLSDAVVSRPIRAPSSLIAGGFKCHDTIFERDVSFFNAEFRGPVSVIDGRFKETRFRGADFRSPESQNQHEVRFQWVQFEGYADFRDTTFGTVVFHDNDAGEIHLSGLIEDGQFDNFLVTETLKFDYLKCDKLDLSNSHLEHLSIGYLTAINHESTIQLQNAKILSGCLDLRDNSVAYDFTEATVGPLQLNNTAERQFGDHILFSKTNFDGFDFSRYFSLLEPNWWIHPQEDSIQDSNEPNAFDELILTYTRAKNGANVVSDNVSASRFFISEMVYKRKQHWLAFKQSEGLKKRTHAVRYCKNALLYATSKYGERTSWALIVGAVFLLVWEFIVVYVPLLSGTVDLIESFFVALVVFTLTRSIYR